ncbi:hypothetical protein HJG60_011264 [Phyllostomus discolor]|uniref:Uncharacterized protein n=1 Tax=Phyllostomus discolor TaxID=89673 RepID=A0A834A7J0_9CHIR|nr:hypothetical protein HJG60_011264 [Phyllostomus discolor]
MKKSSILTMRKNKQCTEGTRFILPGLPLCVLNSQRQQSSLVPFLANTRVQPLTEHPCKASRHQGGREQALLKVPMLVGPGLGGRTDLRRWSILLACLDNYHKEERQLKGVPRCSINVVSVSLLCALRKMLVLNAFICR